MTAWCWPTASGPGCGTWTLFSIPPLAWPQHLAGALITEGVRSAGAYMLNGLGERFVDELETRDLVSSAILQECAKRCAVAVGEETRGVWLDTPGLELRNPGALATRFPKLIQLGKRRGIGLHHQSLLIYPTLHYQNGGVVVEGAGRCHLLNGTVKALESSFYHFMDEYERSICSWRLSTLTQH